MKTPSYQRKADKEWRKRKAAEGWIVWQVFGPAEIVNRLKSLYKKLKHNSKGGKEI